MSGALIIVLIVLGILIVATLIAAVFAVRAIRHPQQRPSPVSRARSQSADGIPPSTAPELSKASRSPVAPQPQPSQSHVTSSHTVTQTPSQVHHSESAYALVPRLMTSAELSFAQALNAAVPGGLLIFPQVRLAGKHMANIQISAALN